MHKDWSDEAWEDYLYWQGQDKKTLRKINRLLRDIDRNGYNCTGKPEALSEDLAGFWSVRIEKTALAAGFRPCGNCMRAEYKEYMADPEGYRAQFGL